MLKKEIHVINAWVPQSIHARLIALCGVAVVSGIAAASEPANDSPSTAEMVSAAASGVSFTATLEVRPICSACSDDGDANALTTLIGTFSASGVLRDSDVESLYDADLATASQFRITGSTDLNFDGKLDSDPSRGHGLLGVVEVYVEYYNDDYDLLGEFATTRTFSTGLEVFTIPFAAPAGAVTADIYADPPLDDGGDPGCAGSDRDYIVIQGLEPGALYTVRMYGLPESGFATFTSAWTLIDSTFGSEDELPELALSADPSGRVRLAVTSMYDENVDGLDDVSLCPHAVSGAYTLLVSREVPAAECLADYNGDLQGDIADLLDFLDDFGMCMNQPMPCGVLGNLDIAPDGFVDILDLLDFLEYFSEGCPVILPPAAPGNVSMDFPGDGMVVVRWNDLSNDESYFAVALTDDFGDIELSSFMPANSSAASFDLRGELVGGSTLFATVCAVNDGGETCADAEATVPDPCPIAPSPLTWEYVRPGSVMLRWIDVCDQEEGYNVARTIGADPDFDRIATVDPNTTSYKYIGMTAGLTYHFRVRGVLDSSFTPYSNTLSVAVPSNPPNAPSALRVENLASRSLDLRWNDNSANEQEFRVAKGFDGVNFDYIGGTGPNGTTFHVPNLLPNTTYKFRMRAANLAGYSAYTSVLSITTPSDPPTIPNAPSNCRITEIDPLSAIVRWDDNSNNETEFRIAISRDGINWDAAEIVGANVTSKRISGLCPETPYWLKVRAANAAGYSAYTNAAPFTTVKLYAPYDLVAARDEGTPALDVVITWTNPPGSNDGTRIARSTDNLNWDHIATVGPGVSSYRDASSVLVSGRRYYYRSRAYKDCGGDRYYSEYSNTDDSIPR